MGLNGVLAAYVPNLGNNSMTTLSNALPQIQCFKSQCHGCGGLSGFFLCTFSNLELDLLGVQQTVDISFHSLDRLLLDGLS